MVSRLLHSGVQRVCAMHCASATKVKLLLNALDPMRIYFVCQACNSWKQFTYDETWGTGEGRAKLVQDKLLENWMNDEAKLTQIDQLFGYADMSFVCNDQHIFFYGDGRKTSVFDMSGKWVKNLGKDPVLQAAVGKEILAALTGKSTIIVWSTSGDMEQLHDLQLTDFGVSGSSRLAAVVVVGKADWNKVLIMTTSSMHYWLRWSIGF